MSRKKQVEKIKDCIDSVYGSDCAYYGVDGFAIAEALYDAGYRKQEWISVEERLPTLEDGKVLIYTPYGISIAQKTTTNHWKGENAIPKLITHWMPLPEPPKGEQT